MNRCFVFDLDGTITEQEILPLIAAELALEEELSTLTDLTLKGLINFEQSFKLRFAILKLVPTQRVREIVSKVTLNNHISNFIKVNKEKCFIATGNLNLWIKPIIESLGCRAFTSCAFEDDYGNLSKLEILRKNKAVHLLREQFDEVVVIGESFNDLPMFEAANIGIAFGGVHQPVKEVINAANYVIYEGGALCQLLNML